MNEFDARAILGVDHDAPYGEIKKSYEFLSQVISDGFQNQDTLSLVRGHEALNRINEAWEYVESLHWLGVLGQRTDDWSNELHWGLSDGFRVANSDECEMCGSRPAASIHVGAISSTVYRLKRISHRGSFCRTCGNTIARSLISRTLTRGWWGPGIVFVAYFTSINLRSISRLNRISNPLTKDPTILVPYDEPLPLVSNPFLNRKAISSTVLAMVLFATILHQLGPDVLKSGSDYQATGSSLNYPNIAKTAQDRFLESVERGAAESNIDLVIDPTVDSDFVKSVNDNVRDFAEIFSAELGQTEFSIVVFKSRKWGFDALEKYSGQSDSYFLESLTQDFDKDGLFGQPCAGPGVPGMSYSNYFDHPVIAISETCGWKSSEPDDGLQEQNILTINHELTHGLQKVLVNREVCAPAWFVEGQANFVAAVTTALNGKQLYDSGSDGWRYGSVNDGELAKLESNAGWEVAKNINLSTYNEGALALQLLVAKYGWEKVVELTAESSDPHCDSVHFDKFERVFKSVIGITLKRFYVDAEPFLRYLNPELLNRLNSASKPGWMLWPFDKSEYPSLVGWYSSGACEIWEYANAREAEISGEDALNDGSAKHVWFHKDGFGQHGVVLLSDSKSTRCVNSAMKVLNWKDNRQ